MRIKEERDRRMMMQSQAQASYKDEETDSESEQPNSPSYPAVSDGNKLNYDAVNCVLSSEVKF